MTDLRPRSIRLIPIRNSISAVVLPQLDILICALPARKQLFINKLAERQVIKHPLPIISQKNEEPMLILQQVMHA